MTSCKDGKESSGNVKCRGFLDWNKKFISLPRGTVLHWRARCGNKCMWPRSCVVVQEISPQPVIASLELRDRSVHVGFVVDKVAVGRLSPSTSCFCSHWSSTSDLQISSIIYTI
jgi:hypothetical protein